MNSKNSIILCLLSLIVNIVSAQTDIKGTITDKEDDSPLQSVLVVLKDIEKKTIIRYTSTDENGEFILPLESDKERATCFLHVSSMGYKPQEISLVEAPMHLDIQLVPAVIKLNEVAIKAQSIREQGDTVIYNVASFSDKQDKTIGDVLQKMPGITIDASGAISYNGTSINKFYIEGRDLLEGQYGLATNGISPADVGRIEIMEEHQPIRALQGISYSSQPALNLRLRQDSKAKWIVNVLGTGGISSQLEGSLWAGETFAMRMKGNNQNITLYKGNNIGKDLTAEVSDLTALIDPMNFSDYIRIGGISAPDLEKKRTLFNRSHLFSSSQLWGMKNGWEAKNQLNYLNDRLESVSASEATYYLPDENKVIVEKHQALQQTHHLYGRFSLEANKETFYLKNNLKTNLQYQDVTTLTIGTIPNVQEALHPFYRITNDLQLVKRLRNQFVTFYSYNDWQNRPQSLQVVHNGNLQQQVRETGFLTHEHTSYGWKIKKVTLSTEGGVKAMFRSLNSLLSDFTDTLGIPVNHEMTNYANFYIIPKLEYKYRRWEGALEMPMNYYYYSFRNQLSNESDWLASPSLRLRWNMTPSLILTVRGSMRSKECDIRSLYSGFILTDYRTLQQGMNEYSIGKGQSLNGTLMYRNPSNGIFGNVMMMRSWNENKFMSSSLFVGDYIVRSYTRSPNKNDVWTLMGSLGSNVGVLHGMAGINVFFQRNNSTMLSEGEHTNYANQSLNTTARLNGRIGKVLNWQYHATYRLNQMEVAQRKVQNLDQWKHAFVITAFPTKNLQLQMTGEYYNNEVSKNIHKSIILLDSKLTYCLCRSLEISATLSNLFNKRTYDYTLYSELNSTTYEHRLRGRELLVSIYWKK